MLLNLATLSAVATGRGRGIVIPVTLISAAAQCVLRGHRRRATQTLPGLLLQLAHTARATVKAGAQYRGFPSKARNGGRLRYCRRQMGESWIGGKQKGQLLLDLKPVAVPVVGYGYRPSNN